MLNKYLLECNYGAVYLLVGVGGHQGISDECVLRSTSGRYDRIDEHASLECECGDKECLVDIAHIEGDDGTLGLANLESLLTETLQGVVGDLPQGFDAFRLLLDNVEGSIAAAVAAGLLDAEKM